MKNLIIFFFLVCAATLQAQDIIVLKTTDEIKAIVQEVSTDAIKYKKQENPQGPTYTISKADVFMIKYKNGDKDVFASEAPKANEPKPQPAINEGIWLDKKQYYLNDKPITYKEYNETLKTNPKVWSQVKTARTMGVTGGVIATASIITFGVVLFTGETDKSTGKMTFNKPLGLTSAAGMIGGVIMLRVGYNKEKKAVQTYNSHLQANKKTSYELKVGVTDSGIGLALSF